MSPLGAVSQHYEELRSDVRIHWNKCTIDESGHKPLDQLTNDYDISAIDHPRAGFCFGRNLDLDLRNLLSIHQRNDLEKNCVGSSFKSYVFEAKLLATPINLSTIVLNGRQDMVIKNGFQLPAIWNDLISMADRNHVIMPEFRADLFLNWLMLVHALDARFFDSTDTIAEKEKAIAVMSLLERLAEPMADEIVDLNLIIIAELMSRQGRFVYCLFACSYNNYCRSSFVDKPLKYGSLIEFNGGPLRSILGGTSIIISSGCKEIELVFDFPLRCSGGDVQANIYTYAGGQAARKEAWISIELVSFTGGFFADSHLSHESALVRPRYDGYVFLQEKEVFHFDNLLRGIYPQLRPGRLSGPVIIRAGCLKSDYLLIKSLKIGYE